MGENKTGNNGGRALWLAKKVSETSVPRFRINSDFCLSKVRFRYQIKQYDSE